MSYTNILKFTTLTAQKFKYNVTFYLPMFIRLILLKDSLFNASKIGVIKYRSVVKDNICIYTIIRVDSAFSLVASCVLLKYTRTDDVN